VTPKKDHRGRPVYKVNGNGNSYTIRIPPEVGQHIEGREFAFQLTEDGFAYDPDCVVLPPMPEELPAWLQDLQGRPSD